MTALIQICLATIVTFSASGLTQTLSVPRLQKQGDVVKQEIKGGETKSFPVTLTAGQYTRIRTEQHGSILIVSLFDPQRKEIVRMDNPAGGHGPIIISTIASVSGEYRLEVFSKDKWANPANFEVVIDGSRNPLPEDQTIIDAQQALAEGRKNSWANNATAALPHYERALTLWTSVNDERSQALTYFALNQAYSTIGGRERPKAIKALEALLALVNGRLAPNDWRLKAAALNDLGSLYTRSGKVDSAFSLLQEAFDLFSSHHDRRGQASSLNNLAIANARIGYFSKARELVQQALPLRYAENDQAGAINLINSLGAASDRLGEPEQALEYFEKALKDWQKLGELTPNDRGRVAILLQNLAIANDKLGQWEKARDYYDQALAMLGEGDEGRPAALDSKGELYASLGNLKIARDCYDEALRILPAENFDPDLKAGILVHLGQLFSLRDETANAVSSFQQGRDLKPSAPKLADVLTNLAVALAAQGKLDEAMPAYNQALAIQLELQDKRGQALTLQKRGETYNLLKQNAPALDDLKKALVLWEGLKDPRGQAATLNTLAQVEQDRGNTREALKYSDEVLSIVESQRTTLSSLRLRASYFATQENYYDLNIDLNMQLSRSAGVEYVARAFATAEKARARVLLETLREAGVDRLEPSRSSDPLISSLLDQLHKFKTRLAAKAQARTGLLNTTPNPAQLAALNKEIDAISEKCDSLEAQVRSQRPHLVALTKPQPVGLETAQQQLDSDTLLFEFALGDKRSYVWAVTNDTIRGFELAPREQIESHATRLLRAITERNHNDPRELPIQSKTRWNKADKEYLDAAAALSKLILAPVATTLQQKRLLVVADGALQLVPFGLLPDPTEPSFLIAKHEIVSLPSTSVLALQRQELANRKLAPYSVAVVADPVFELNDQRVALALAKANKRTRETKPKREAPQPATLLSTSQNATLSSALRSAEDDPGATLHRLIMSRTEAAEIARVVPVKQLFKAVDFQANRSLLEGGELAKYRVIHLATHGIIDLEHPELSGIVLSMVNEQGKEQDGYVRLYEIYNLKLPAELVVLSACQTGVGKQVRGEGMIALTRGFMYAGAARVVASLWKVDDSATADLMALFYKEMFTNNKKPAAALREAQIQMSKRNRWQSPYYWAGFVLQGEWR